MSFIEFSHQFNLIDFLIGALVSSLLLAVAHLIPRSYSAKKATDLLFEHPGFVAVNEWSLLIRYTYGTASLIVGLAVFFLLSNTLILVLPFVGMAVVAGITRVVFAAWIAFWVESEKKDGMIEKLNANTRKI